MTNVELCNEIIRLLEQREKNANMLRIECQNKNSINKMIQHLGESYGLLTAIDVVKGVRATIIGGLME